VRFAIALLLTTGSWLLASGPCAAQDDPFAAGVRTTPWLKPEDEQKAFKLPPGFEINLVAAEPEIQKPLNMAFDERGRIWLTCTVEYPYAAPLDRPGRDSIRVLEDTDGDGRYEKVTVFADGLNIPIGIYPYKGGCIAWSIPNIWHFEDTDGDGRCDKRTVLYGPFDHTRDVHGNCNAFRRGFDGWIYACHGFNNDSHVRGSDGHEVHLNSGNTFRFKIDGSRIEHFTHGQVNPFGMCFDELFDIFTADCHSKPLTQLIRGGYYPSFGKPHDGLGFVPSMMDHSHGSTAICGVVKYSGENFPKEYRGNFLSGNVMTSRINQNKPEYHGSTIRAIEQPDFLSTTDPWFRPVDLQIGPDGALYILDFYNRIIGHYEVPLPHPGRDRTSGRIWRVAFQGSGVSRQESGEDRGQRTADGAVGNALRGVPGTGKAAKPGQFDLTKMSIDELIAQLDSPQLEHRLRVLNYLADVKGTDCAAHVRRALDSPNSPAQRIGCMWILERLESLTKDDRVSLASNPDRTVRIHAVKLAAERFAYQPADRDAATARLGDSDAFVARAAAEALARHDIASFEPLLAAWDTAPVDDSLLEHAVRMAVRRNLTSSLSPEGYVPGVFSSLTEKRHRQLAQIASLIPNDQAAAYVAYHLQTYPESDDVVANYVPHVARYVVVLPHNRDFVQWAKARAGDNLDLAAKLSLSLATGADSNVRSKARPWATEVARELLANDRNDIIGWTAVPVEGKPASENPWVIAPRRCADGVNDQPFFYSLPKGEQRTGIYRSAAFKIPAKLSFWCAGHSGFPGQPLNDGNYVRLRDAKSHAVLAEARPPRNDVAQLVEWDLSKIAPTPPAPLPQGARGERSGYVELVDDDTAGAYAWLAVGRFSLAGLNPTDTARKQQLAAEIVGKLKLAALRPKLAELVSADRTDDAARAAIGQALVALAPDSRAAALVAALGAPEIGAELRLSIGSALAERADEKYVTNLRDVMKLAPSRLQTTLAETLAGDAAGAGALLTLVESGHASPRLLLAPSVSAKLAALADANVDERVSAAAVRLPPANEVLDKLIVERLAGFARATPDLARGEAAFTKHCAACHQIAGKGAVVGPQLDGIGGRGLARIVEDVLDPNRNVDVAFRTTTLRLADGRVLSGLFRRADGGQLVFADNQGKEFTVAKVEISQEQKTALSLMPANVPEIVPADEFNDLVAWLLSQRAKPAK
jgi:putative heme-binding domain-containing protein